MGNANIGKSTTVRALTGMQNKRSGRNWKIASTKSGKTEFCVLGTSLQEIPISQEDFVKKYKNHKNILLTLRINPSRYNGCGADYVQHFVKCGWNISEIVLLIEEDKPQGIRNTLQNIRELPIPLVIAPQIQAANAIAGIIRKRWNWL